MLSTPGPNTIIVANGSSQSGPGEGNPPFPIAPFIVGWGGGKGVIFMQSTAQYVGPETTLPGDTYIIASWYAADGVCIIPELGPRLDADNPKVGFLFEAPAGQIVFSGQVDGDGYSGLDIAICREAPLSLTLSR